MVGPNLITLLGVLILSAMIYGLLKIHMDEIFAGLLATGFLSLGIMVNLYGVPYGMPNLDLIKVGAAIGIIATIAYYLYERDKVYPDKRIYKAWGFVVFISILIVIGGLFTTTDRYHDHYYGSLSPAGTWNEMGASSSTEGYAQFGTFSFDVKPLDFKIFAIANGSDIGVLEFTTNTGTAPQDMTWHNGPEGAEATYFDYNPAGGEINQGDYINLTGLSPDTAYEFEVFHTKTNTVVPMTGVDGNFTTEP